MASLHGAGFVVARSHGDAAGGYEFLLLRNAVHGSWGFPKGHLEAGESPLQAAWRELAEETGLGPADVRLCEGVKERVAYTVPANVWGPGRPPMPTPKQVTYFAAVLAEGARPVQASSEHVTAEWLPQAEAEARLAERTPDLAALLERVAARLPRRPGS